MTNNYHRYLNLPFEVEMPELFKTFSTKRQHVDNEKFNYQSVEMINFLSKFGLKPLKTEAFYTAPQTKLPIHVDGAIGVKINKTWGPEGGVTRWYKPGKVFPLTGMQLGEEQTRIYGEEVYIADEETSELLYEASTNRISLINVAEYHGTYNPSLTEGRWTLCFQFQTDTNPCITWDEALEIFKDYIED